MPPLLVLAKIGAVTTPQDDNILLARVRDRQDAKRKRGDHNARLAAHAVLQEQVRQAVDALKERDRRLNRVQHALDVLSDRGDIFDRVLFLGAPSLRSRP